EYVRDPLGRVVKRILPDGSAYTFEFNGRGDILSAETPDCKVTFVRDALGRVVKEVQGKNFVENTFDPVDNVIRQKTSLGLALNYTYDGNGDLTQLNVEAYGTLEFGRNAYGEETARTLPGGIK